MVLQKNREVFLMNRTVPVEEAVNMVIPHDITEIRPGEFKGPAFKRGHVIRQEDIPHLKRLGKERIFVFDLGPGELHEDEAAIRMARAVAGQGVEYSKEIAEGKVGFKAAIDGLLKVETEALFRFNLPGDVMLATRHTDTVVKRGEKLGAGRAIPLVIREEAVNRAVAIGQEAGGILKVLPFRKSRAGLVITGNEVYYGRIKDAFEPVLRKKVESFGGQVINVRFAPDDPDVIARHIRSCLDAGADLILTSGGMSVDPDDVARHGIRKAGAVDVVYGSSVLPGAMFLVAYIEGVPVLGMPACGMYFKTTVLDLVFPRILAGEKIGRTEIAALGHGGFCLGCRECRYPLCPFGKG